MEKIIFSICFFNSVVLCKQKIKLLRNHLFEGRFVMCILCNTLNALNAGYSSSEHLLFLLFCIAGRDASQFFLTIVRKVVEPFMQFTIEGVDMNKKGVQI